MVPHIIHTLRKCIESSLPLAPKDIKLKRFVAQSYIGLFMEEEEAQWFRDLLQTFSAEAKRHGVVVEPHKRQVSGGGGI